MGIKRVGAVLFLRLWELTCICWKSIPFGQDYSPLGFIVLTVHFISQRLCIFVLVSLLKNKDNRKQNKSSIVLTVICWHAWNLTSIMSEAKVLDEPASCQWHLAKLGLLHSSLRGLTDFPYKCWDHILQPQSTHFSWKKKVK